MRVVRAERELEKAHLIAKDRDGWELKEKGKKALKALSVPGAVPSGDDTD